MQLRNFTVTLTATAAAITSDDVYCRQIYLQPGASNSNPMYVGGPALTSANGIRLEGYDADGLPSAPFPLMFGQDNPMQADKVYVLGTAGQTVNVLLVTV